MSRNRPVLCGVTLFCAGAVLQAGVFREFYISPAGADTNPGTLAQPFLTLSHARDAVRAVRAEMAGDIIVYLRGGTYAVTSPVEFTTADSGTNGFKVIYSAFASEAPVLGGGVTVTNWTLDHGQVYKATLDRETKLRTLYVNGVRAEMAQADFTGKGTYGSFVVAGTEPWAETAGQTYDGVLFDAVPLPEPANAADVELAQARNYNLLIVGVREAATVSNRTVLKLQQPYGAIAATMSYGCNFNPSGVFTVRNAYEFLDEPGQFYFNRATHTLYYFSNGEDLSTATVIAPLSEGLLRITGNSTNDRVQNLEFTGLTFAYDHYVLKQVGESRAMVGAQSLGLYTRFRADGDHHPSHYNMLDLPQGTVELRNCANIRFERNRFAHLGSACGICLVNDVVDSAVVGNCFTDISGNAVNVGHPQHYAIDDGGGLFAPGIEGVCARLEVKNNWIRDVCREFKQEEALTGFFTEAVELSHNDIQGVPYGGIALGWWWWSSELPPSTVTKNNVIAHNRIFNRV